MSRPPKHRVLLLGLTLLAAIGVLAWRAGRDEGSHDGPSTIPRERDRDAPPLLRGAQKPGPSGREQPPASSEPPPRGEARALTGVVRDQSAEPVGGATVFLIEKGVEGLHRRFGREHVPPRTRAGVDGHFDLGERRPGGHWLGVTASGFMPHHVDGDDVRPGAPVDVTLVRAPEVRIRVRSGDAPAPEGTRVSAFGEGPAYVFPGPDAAWHAGSGVELPDGGGDVILCPPSEGPVIVRAYRHGYVSRPPEVRIERLPGRATFDLQPSCVFRFRVVDAVTGKPPARGFDYGVTRDDGTRTGGGTKLADGSMDVADGIRPGSWAVEISARGYRTWRQEGVDLPTHGAEATVEARLEPDPDIGHLRVVVPMLAELPRVKHAWGGESAAPASIWLRKEGGAWTRTTTGWAAGSEETRETDTDYLVSFLDAGVYDVFAWNRVSGRTACHLGVRVPALRTTAVTLELRPGLYVDLATVLPAESTYARLRLRSPVFGAFPFFFVTDVAGTTYGEEDLPPRDRRYGPYPGDELVLEAETRTGRIETFTIRR